MSSIKLQPPQETEEIKGRCVLDATLRTFSEPNTPMFHTNKVWHSIGSYLSQTHFKEKIIIAFRGEKSAGAAQITDLIGVGLEGDLLDFFTVAPEPIQLLARDRILPIMGYTRLSVNNAAANVGFWSDEVGTAHFSCTKESFENSIRIPGKLFAHLDLVQMYWDVRANLNASQFQSAVKLAERRLDSWGGGDNWEQRLHLTKQEWESLVSPKSTKQDIINIKITMNDLGYLPPK